MMTQEVASKVLGNIFEEGWTQLQKCHEEAEATLNLKIRKYPLLTLPNVLDQYPVNDALALSTSLQQNNAFSSCFTNLVSLARKHLPQEEAMQDLRVFGG